MSSRSTLSVPDIRLVIFSSFSLYTQEQQDVLFHFGRILQNQNLSVSAGEDFKNPSKVPSDSNATCGTRSSHLEPTGCEFYTQQTTALPQSVDGLRVHTTISFYCSKMHGQFQGSAGGHSYRSAPTGPSEIKFLVSLTGPFEINTL